MLFTEWQNTWSSHSLIKYVVPIRCVISSCVTPYRPSLVLLQCLLLELYLILLPVFIQNHWGMGQFCFCFLDRIAWFWKSCEKIWQETATHSRIAAKKSLRDTFMHLPYAFPQTFENASIYRKVVSWQTVSLPCFFLELSIWYSPYASVSQTAVSSGGNLPSAGYLQCINGLKNMFWKGHVFDFIYGAKLSIDTWLVRGRKILILIVFRNTDSLFLFSETATLCRLPQWNQIRLLFSPWQISWLFTQAICSSLYSASWWLFHFTFYI